MSLLFKCYLHSLQRVLFTKLNRYKNNDIEETIKLSNINIWKNNNKHLQIILRFQIMLFDCKLIKIL